MEWKLELALIDPTGRVYTRVIINVSPFDVPMLTPPHEFDGRNFESTVQVMKEREKRTTFLKDAAPLLGAAMAQRLQDKEGWHGPSRAETIRGQDGR